MTGNPPVADPAGGDGALLAEAGSVPPVLDQIFSSGTLYALRAAVQAHAVAAGMPERRADDAVIAIHELAANMIQHGPGRGRLRMWHMPGALRFQVDDGGAPAWSDGDGANTADGWPYVKGHGLWLVREVADQMSMFSGRGGTRATVIFTLPR
jgi:anti-sigma regulatory factor (Ser/Thr protein kinase)